MPLSCGCCSCRHWCRFLDAGTGGCRIGRQRCCACSLRLWPVLIGSWNLPPIRGRRATVLVEGISDQAALETLAVRLGRDLRTEEVVVEPMGGAHALGRHLKRLG